MFSGILNPMKRSYLFLLLLFFLTACGCTRSWAEIFRYQDPKSEFTLNYPDRWGRVHNQQPDDVVTIAAPDQDDFATCRMRVRDDNRFTIYPDRLADSVQKVHYSTDFWESYLGEYNDGILLSINDGAGLGRGYASIAEASYNGHVGYQGAKRAVMAVSPYYDKVYIFECSAREESFDRWLPGFTNIMRSVDFKKLMYGHPNGEYRDFISEGDVIVKGRKIQDTYHQ